MTQKYDFIIINLKVLSQTPRNRKLRTNSKGYFTLEDDSIFLPVKRMIWGESRGKLVRDINYLISETQEQVKTMLLSKCLHEKKDHDIVDVNDDKRILLNQISSIHRELEKCIIGIDNLKTTYSDDKLTSGELEYISDKIGELMNEIVLKVPNVCTDTLSIFVSS